MAFEDDLFNFGSLKSTEPLKPTAKPTQPQPTTPQPAAAKPMPTSQPTFKQPIFPPSAGYGPQPTGFKQPGFMPQTGFGPGGYMQGGYMPQPGFGQPGFMGPAGYGTQAGFASQFAQPQPQPQAQNSAFVPAHMEERDQLDPKITEKIKLWAERGGRKNNLRALLSTVHEVLWEESGWETKGLAELVTSAQVKKAYRQANLIVHPDKVATGTTEQKLIAQRIFETLREGYEVFKTENP